MTHRFEAYSVEGKFDGVNWVDFKNDIITDFTCNYGIMSNDAQIRIADIGSLTFDLNNTETNSAGLVGYYSPGNANCRDGFRPGLEVQVTFTLSGTKVEKWHGRLAMDGIKPQPGNYSSRHTFIKAVDWMEQASINEIRALPMETDKDMADGIAAILAILPIQPPGTVYYGTMESIFSTLFDMTTANSTVLSEMGKMANSELGYIYPTRTGLRVEGRLTRNEEKTALDEYPQAKTDLDLVLWENTPDEHVVNEDGDRILISEATSAIFDNAQFDADITYATNYYNEVKFVAYPRRADAAATTELFVLNSAMEIQAGETLVLRGRYKDPTGIAQTVSAMTDTMSSDIHCYQNEDGSGTDYTGNLTISEVWGTGEFEITIENTGAAGWITVLKAIGKGVYADQPIEYLVQDSVGIALYGRRPITVDMKYQDDASVARYWALVKLYQYSNLNTYVNSITFHASRKAEYLYAFLYIEPGDRVQIKEDVTGVSGDYFVQGIKFTMKRGGVLDFTWVLKSTGLDTWNFAIWDGVGTWDDPIYGWDF